MAAIRLAAVISAAALLLACSTADAFIGVLGSKGKGACEKEGGLCFTQDACCEDFTCEKASQATYGRCTPNKAQLTGQQAGGRDCESDADCLTGQCCSQEAAGYRGLGSRQVCRQSGTGCAGQSAENLFQQYYSGLFRKRGGPGDNPHKDQ